MKTVIGDIIKDAKKYDVVVHGCNCFSVMGAGIARTIRKFYPEAFEVDKNSKLKPIHKLGGITYTEHTTPIIVNAYTQYDFRNKNDVEYCAIRSALRKVKARYTGKKIALPLIGAGLAGGNWDVIKGIVKEVLEGEDVTVIIWENDIDNYKYADTYTAPIKPTPPAPPSAPLDQLTITDLID